MYRAGIWLMSLILPVFGLGAYLAFDYWNVNRMARGGEGDGVSVTEYLSGWLSLADALSAGDAGDMPQELAAMLPAPPPGWTVQPTEPADLDALVPAMAETEAGMKRLAEVRAIAAGREGNGIRDARLTYRNGARTVVFEVMRYPDFIFTSFAAMQLKMELQMGSLGDGARRFLTVRGMEFVEKDLPEGYGLRYFEGNLSAQVWVRVLASTPMTDEDLLPFFQTLHVPALNGQVIEQVAGMGEVPVIVLASALAAEDRARWEAARDAEALRLAGDRAARAAEEEAARAAEAQAKADRKQGIETDAETGVVIRKGAAEGSVAAKDRKAAGGGLADSGCTQEGGRKVCGGQAGATGD